MRMRAGEVEKKIVEELLPICRYVQAHYGPGRYISVKWVNGSQHFDAVVHQSGSFVDHGQFPSTAHLEVTGAVHPNDYLSRELIDNGGVAFGVEGVQRLPKTREIRSRPIIRTNLDFVDSFCSIVMTQIARKALIDYPADTTLIVQCTLNTLYTPDEWQTLAVRVREALPAHKFGEIFMYDAVSQLCTSFYGDKYKGPPSGAGRRILTG